MIDITLTCSDGGAIGDNLFFQVLRVVVVLNRMQLIMLVGTTRLRRCDMQLPLSGPRYQCGATSRNDVTTYI
jgi:hypothetical protein